MKTKIEKLREQIEKHKASLNGFTLVNSTYLNGSRVLKTALDICDKYAQLVNLIENGKVYHEKTSLS